MSNASPETLSTISVKKFDKAKLQIKQDSVKPAP
jgi:hypothetical protein